jgi:hypothetical protein
MAANPLIWQTPTTTAGTTDDGKPWRAALVPVATGGWNARVTLPSGEEETTHHETQEAAAKAAEWALARAGCVQKPVDLMLAELLVQPPG